MYVSNFIPREINFVK